MKVQSYIRHGSHFSVLQREGNQRQAKSQVLRTASLAQKRPVLKQVGGKDQDARLSPDLHVCVVAGACPYSQHAHKHASYTHMQNIKSNKTSAGIK